MRYESHKGKRSESHTQIKAAKLTRDDWFLARNVIVECNTSRIEEFWKSNPDYGKDEPTRTHRNHITNFK
jgi:hypothetical protein